MGIYILYIQWVLTNTFKNSGEGSNLMGSDLSSESDAGSTDNFQSCISAKDHQDSTRLESSDSRPNKVTSFTESESEEEEEREQFTRELFMVSQSIKVSESSRRPDPTDQLPRRKLVEDAQTWEYSTHTGSVKTPLTNSSR